MRSSSIAARLPRYGVTAFCPTTVACSPEALRRVLEQVRRAREAPAPGAARVLPAHLESNFINPEYKGAQPAACLRSPRAALDAWTRATPRCETRPRWRCPSKPADILREIERAAPDVGIVTLAPELDGGLDLDRVAVVAGPSCLARSLGGHVRRGADGHRRRRAARDAPVQSHAAARPSLARPGRRDPRRAEEVAAEIICDGFHVHPALVRTAVAAKRPSRVLAITDGTAASGLPAGGTASLGDETITVGETAAFLRDGTLAGSVLTMDGAFRMLVERAGLSLVDAATMCATTPARELGLVGHGVLAVDGIADVVILDRRLSVVQTYIGGQLAYSRTQV